LLHTVANLIFYFVFSPKLVLLSALPKFLHSFMVKKGVPSCSSEKFNLKWCQSFLFLFLLF